MVEKIITKDTDSVDGVESSETGILSTTFSLSDELNDVCEIPDPVEESEKYEIDELDQLSSLPTLAGLENEEDVVEGTAKKRKKKINQDKIDTIIKEHNLNETDLECLTKINSAYLTNVGFFLSLREILSMHPNKSKAMVHFDIRKSYTGFHDWHKGARIDLPEVGMNSLAEKMGYSLKLVPINENTDPSHLRALDELQENFLKDIRNEVQENLMPQIKKKKQPKKQKQNISNTLNFLHNGDTTFDMNQDVEPLSMDNEAFVAEDSVYVDNSGEGIEESNTVLSNEISFENGGTSLTMDIGSVSFDMDSNKMSITDMNFDMTSPLMEDEIIDSDNDYQKANETLHDAIGGNIAGVIHDEDEFSDFDMGSYSDDLNPDDFGAPKGEKDLVTYVTDNGEKLKN